MATLASPRMNQPRADEPTLSDYAMLTRPTRRGSRYLGDIQRVLGSVIPGLYETGMQQTPPQPMARIDNSVTRRPIARREKPSSRGPFSIGHHGEIVGWRQ